MIKKIMSVIAVGAITLTTVGAAVVSSNAPVLEDQYVLIDECYVPLEDAMEIGTCQTGGTTCTYTQKPNATPDDCDPDNFTSNNDGQHFELN